MSNIKLVNGEGRTFFNFKRLEGWRYLRVLDTRTLLTDSKIKRMNMEGGLLTRLWDVHISIPIGLFH